LRILKGKFEQESEFKIKFSPKAKIIDIEKHDFSSITKENENSHKKAVDFTSKQSIIQNKFDTPQLSPTKHSQGINSIIKIF
jgi:hypothetical protein